MSIREAWNLTIELMQDPSSRVFAAVCDWEYPMSREAFILADIHDRFTAVNFKSPKPYPRPLPDGKRRSKAPTVDQATVRRALAARGHGRTSTTPPLAPKRDPRHPEWDAMDHLLALEEGRIEGREET